jgi:hypothetical protein
MVICKVRFFFNICKIAASCMLIAFIASCASSGITLFKLVPAQGQMSTQAIHDGKVVLSARYLDAAERAAYLRQMGYEILGHGLQQVSLVTFALEVENGSDQKFILDPGSIRLIVGYGPPLSPYNYAHLYMELPPDSDRQQILVDLRKAIFDKSTTIEPGEKSSKLLLFARPEQVGPAAAVLFERLYVGDREYKAALEFKTVDLEE